MTYSNAFIASQCVAGLAFIAGIRGFLSKEHKNLLINFAICSFLSAVHFILLGAWTAAAVITISGVRHVVAIYSKKKRLMVIFLLIVIASTFLTYNNPVNILAAVAALLGTIGSFSRNTAKARKIWMGSSSSYILHNILVHSPVATAMEAVFLICNIMAYRRHFYRKDATTL